MAVNIGAIGVRISVPAAVVRGVAVNPSKADSIAVPAIVERSHNNATPAAPGGFGRNSH